MEVRLESMKKTSENVSKIWKKRIFFSSSCPLTNFDNKRNNDSTFGGIIKKWKEMYYGIKCSNTNM
uniref:Uncharacterized protein n=1 Tax=Lepeophtheirus salmonis TaxID=72036 RepID=A0A0K2V914_LEPSM